MTFEELSKANKQIVTTNIKGKQYAEVNQRIKVFRMLYPNGEILPEIVSLKEGMVVMKATVSDGEGHILGAGHAYENENSSFINKTSYIENCETSAVGRALGMVGIGIDTSIASVEELENALQQQEALKPIGKTKAKVLHDALIKHKKSEKGLLEMCGVEKLEDINIQQFTTTMNSIGEK